MKIIRVILVIVLTAAALIAILSPSLLSNALPASVVSAVSLDEFPMLRGCVDAAQRLTAAIRGGQRPTLDIVTGSLGPTFWDELSSLLLVAVLTIPVSLLLGLLVYKPLHKGVLVKGLLYVSLNLVAVVIAWVLYRQVFFRYVVDGLIFPKITDETLATVVNALAQLVSAVAIGAVTLWIVFALVATRIVIGKIIMPIIGTVLRTLLFAFLVALMLVTKADTAVWTVSLPLMGVTLIAGGIVDWVFGC